MQVEQYVMAYGIEQDRIRAIIPEGFVSLRPIHKSRKRPIPEIHLQQKMQQKFHADRCWEHIKLFLKDSKVKITKKQS